MILTVNQYLSYIRMQMMLPQHPKNAADSGASSDREMAADPELHPHQDPKIGPSSACEGMKIVWQTIQILDTSLHLQIVVNGAF